MRVENVKARRMSLLCELRPVNVNDNVIYEGRRYLVVGFDPVSVRPKRVYLRDVKTGDPRTCLYDDLVSRIRDANEKRQSKSE